MIGSRVSAYEVLSELGSGGMGAVYLARCAEASAGLDVSTQVALKVIHPNLLSQPGFFKRFLREAQIGQDVQHENVVRTYDCDATDVDGAAAHFLVMEYVEGQTLRDLLDELERVPEELCRHVGCEVAKGLAAIHEVGVVHRDIKPENVLITEDHVVKVMDLGVARLQDEAIRLSQTGAFVGSLEYAAPEQFRSADGEPDGRADLHSLGVVLYELATGQHPYRDEDASKVLRNILDVAPRKAGEVNPQLSPFFEEVIGTLIAKDRDERFADAAALAAVLEEGEQGEWWKDRAKALRIETKRPLRRIRIPRETALYGRDDDLAKLQSLYEKARDGDGQVLLIEGEAGIGKTRLVDEFVGRLRQEGEDLNFLFGSYPPGGAATASGAFSEAYRAQFGAEGLEETLRDHLTVTPLLVPAFAALLKGDAPPKDAEPLTKDSLQTVFVHATRNLAAERPTIVLIDDLHFAPEDARSLFMTLALAVPGHPILLVGTMRPGVDETWISNLTRLDHASQAALPRLGPKDLSALLEDAFRSERLADELGWKIAQRSDGNPFFAFEIIRGLREGQFITQQSDGTWVSTQVIQDIQIPSSVLDLVRARISDLSQGERDLLDVASCCGFEFDPGLLATALGQGRIPVLKGLAQIERAHRLVRSRGRSFVFDHHQVQEAIYDSLPEMLREEYHAAIADALETREQAADKDPQDLDGALCVDLCEHFLRGAQGDKALRYLGPALNHLEGAYVNDQAVSLVTHVLDVPGLLEGSMRSDTLLRLISVLMRLSRYAEAGEACKEVLRISEAPRDPARAAQASGELGWALYRQGQYQEAAFKFESVLKLARDLGDRSMEARAALGLGGVFDSLGQHIEARAAWERALALARETGDRRTESACVTNIGNAFAAEGRSADAIEHYEMSHSPDDGLEGRWRLNSQAITLHNRGVVLAALGDQEAAVSCQETAIRVSREAGFTHLTGTSLMELGRLLEARGELEEAARTHADGIQVLAGVVRDEFAALGHLAYGVLLGRLGHEAEGRAHLRESLAVASEAGAPGVRLLALLQLERLGECEAERVLAAFEEDKDRLHHDVKREVLLLLYDMTGERRYLEDAHRHLMFFVEHAPAQYRETTLTNVRLHREIMEAWDEQQ